MLAALFRRADGRIPLPIRLTRVDGIVWLASFQPVIRAFATATKLDVVLRSAAVRHLFQSFSSRFQRVAVALPVGLPSV
jgi:hypothetical protein